MNTFLETLKYVRLWQRLLRVLSLWNDFISRMVVSRKLLQRGLICLTLGTGDNRGRVGEQGAFQAGQFAVFQQARTVGNADQRAGGVK